jgi:PKD repeat protein
LWSCKDDESLPLQAAFISDTQEIGAGGKVTFQDESTGQPSRWNWYFEGGEPATSILNGPSVTYKTPGTYPVKLIVGRGNDSVVLVKQAYIKVEYPTNLNADFETGNTVIMGGEQIQFTDKSTGMPTSWEWTFTPQSGTALTSTEQNPVVVFTEGIYTVSLKVSNPNASHTKTKTEFLTVLSPNEVSADFSSDFAATYEGGNVVFEDKSIGVVEAWEWTFEGGNPAVSFEQNPTVTYSVKGRYRVTLRVSNPEKESTQIKDAYIVVVPNFEGKLTAFFPFNGNIYDAGPSKQIPVIPLADTEIKLTDADRKSKPNSVATFNGSGGFYVDDGTGDTNGPFNFGTGDYSVSCWVKVPEDATSSQMVWMESGGFGSGDQQTWMRLYSNATRYLTFMIEGSGLNMDNIEEAKTADNQWHHLVCVREGKVTCIYKNGVKLSKTQTATQPDFLAVSNSGNFKVGAQESINKTTGAVSYNNRYKGSLDDLIVYKRALTETEILELYGL